MGKQWVYVNSVAIDTLIAVDVAGKRWDGRWVTAYDISQHVRIHSHNTRFLGMSLLPGLERHDKFLESLHRAGCAKFYRLTPLGKRVLANRDKIVEERGLKKVLV